jgi:hypothetical protein
MNKMTRILALSCAFLSLWIGYALACSPVDGDDWFELAVTIDAKTVPKNFVLKAGRIEKVGARDCVLADGNRFESYALRAFASFAKNNKVGDGRPAHVKLPKAENVALEVYCDPERYVTHGRFSYRRVDWSPDKWTSHMELDLQGTEHLITTSASMVGSASRDLYIDRVKPVTSFCTMSAQHLFDDSPAVDARTFGHGVISLAALTRAKKHVGIDDERLVTTEAAAITKTFEVYIDCYTSKNVIDAKVRYALNKFYDPNQERRSIEACDRRH